MSLATGPFGIEYNPAPRDDDKSPVVGRLVAVVVLVAAVSLGATLVKRWRASSGEEPSVPAAPSPPPAPAAPAAPPVAPAVAQQPGIDRRPPRARNLLMKLEKAEAAGDVVMCISTIEQLRALPGEPVADIDDSLARRLGGLNLAWLFDLHNAQWVKEVKVKPGDSATRIARETASTLASLRRLNGSIDLDRLRAGAKLLVMNQPRFNLVVHRRMRTADLQLNGKFFKRYDLTSAVSGGPGVFESQGNLRQLLAENGVWLALADRSELELLMPKGSSVSISEL